MSAKRALVVDDSKSARAFLSRLLEKHHLDVDTAESAEDAIDYLNRHRPDVIFMDHLMPGMDGFQAVQAIKNNPRTATIPILMYTSQEGELYLGQARALGAVGVLPKQIKPADVATVLHQLNLTEDRHEATAESAVEGEERRSDETVPPAPPAPELHGAHNPPATLTDRLPTLAAYSPLEAANLAELREDIVDLRRLVVAGLDRQSELLLEQFRQIVRDAQPPTPEPVITHRDWRGTLYGIAATLVAVVLAGLWLRGEVERRALQMQVAQLNELHTPAAEPAVAAPAEVPAQISAADPVRKPAAAPPLPGAYPVPYGELPLAGGRVEKLRALLDQLAASGFQGTVEVQAFPGRFCLAGNASDGYSLAPDTTVVTQCELIGNPVDESLGAAQRESLPFANMVAEFRKAHGENIELKLMTGSADQVARPYPDTGGTGRVVAAGEWNAAAMANSRVEVRWHPRS
jgi:CheY-like chemotaxis protein